MISAFIPVMKVMSAYISAMGMISCGSADGVIAGGVETMSDVPLRLSRKLRTRLISMNLKKKRTLSQKLKHMKGIKLKDIMNIEVCERNMAIVSAHFL